MTGASAGIGEGFARQLAARGINLVLVARRKDRLQALARELIAKHGVEIEPLAVDLLDVGQLGLVEARLQAHDSPIDLLVNNAGSETEHAHFCQRDRDRLSDEVQLNLVVLMRLTHAAAVAMTSRQGGHIINVSAGNAFYPTPGAAAYGASKAAVNSLTEALAYELTGTGVRVSAFCPGFTRTGAQARLGLDVARIPRFLWAQPEEVAQAALGAATAGKSIASINALERLNAVVCRHLPRRLLLPLVARANAFVTSAPHSKALT